MRAGIIYYTDCRLETKAPAIFKLVQEYILKSGIPIVSCSLRPLNFGKNIVIKGQASYLTMAKQITAALEASDADYVFFCEHDVLYHPSHFDFIPERDDVYYYNTNNWRWQYPYDYFITYANMASLSSLCCNRELALNHYRLRLRTVEEQNLPISRDPAWVRRWGYEPGRKDKKHGGLTDEKHETRNSLLPNVDIRHGRNFSASPMAPDEFKRLPSDLTFGTFEDIEGWDLRRLFNL